MQNSKFLGIPGFVSTSKLPYSVKRHFLTPMRWLVLTVLLLVIFVLNVNTGSVSIPFEKILTAVFRPDASGAIDRIIWDFRLPKGVTCLLAGAGLALSGLQMQTLFRNALAGPDVLGLSSGASLAVSIVYLVQPAALFGNAINAAWVTSLAACVGCIIVFVVMTIISIRLRENVSLLIVGLMIGAIAASGVSVLQYLSNADQLQVFIIWTFGSVGALDWTELSILSIILLIGIALSLSQVKSLNAWLLGEQYAKSMGISIGRSRFVLILSTSLLTGAITSFCGPIAFIGLAVPHLARLLMNSSNHKILVPATILGGGILLLLCDTVSQSFSQALPINAITALVGAPVVIWVILHYKKMSV